MTIGERECTQIIVTDDSGDVVAVVSDGQIVEKEGYRVTLD